MSSFPWQRLDFMFERLVPAGLRNVNIATSRDGAADILFLHGVTRHWRTFHPMLTELHADFSLAALDFRGHGKSDRAPGAYRVADYVEDALAVMRLAPAPVILYGHSLGAMVALAAAVHAPEHVRAVILEDPPFSTMGRRLPSLPLHRYFAGVNDCLRTTAPDADALFAAFSEIIVGEDADGAPIPIKHQRDELSRRFSAESLAHVDPDALAPIVTGEWLDRFDLTSLASRLIVPALLLQADAAHGGMLTDTDASLIAARPGSRVIRFDGVGHNIHWARPAELASIVRGAGAAGFSRARQEC